MPILARETDIFPGNLLEVVAQDALQDHQWWALYTRSRREKQLMRYLLALEVPFYAPIVSRKSRSPSGRVRTSYLPLFANYVFLYGNAHHRYAALESSCISRCMAVADGQQLTADLRQIHDLIELGHPLTPESKIAPGKRVRVTSGTFEGLEGTVTRRQNKARLIVAVNFMSQGASILLDDCQLQLVD